MKTTWSGATKCLVGLLYCPAPFEYNAALG